MRRHFDGDAVRSCDRRSSERRRCLRRRAVVPAMVAVCGGLSVAPAGVSTLQQLTSEPATRSAVVTAIASEITVDGVLDEPVWSSAPTIGDLIQRDPQTGEPPTERTDVTLLHDAHSLYIGVMCYDSDPEGVLGSQMARDGSLASDDRIELFLDTFRDRRTAYYFATNPSGALVDGLVFGNGELNNDWDATWVVRTRRSERGWAAEFAIPFKSLSFPSGETVWRFNIARQIQRKLEDDRWSGARLELKFLQVSEAGEITGLRGLTQGIGVELRPFIGGNWLHRGASGHDTGTTKPGLDTFYNITPSLKLTGTVNTDFGETEVDTRQINLSRFSLLFPEKRSFFLEDAGVFSFASTGPAPTAGVDNTGAQVFPFFSRRVGLLSGGEVPIDFGLKLTGKIGRTDLGVLDVRAREVPSVVPDRNFLIGRVKRNILRQSYIGAIFTDGHPALPLSSRTFGADVRLATSRLLGKSQNLVVSAYGLRSANEGSSGRDWSYGVSAEYPNDKYIMQFILHDIQENFRPALGFVQRENVRLLRIGANYNPRPKDTLGIQQAIHNLYYTRFTRLDSGEVESWNLLFTWFDWHFKSGDNIYHLLDYNPQYERLFAPFEISPGVVLAPGEYRFTQWNTQVSTAQKRRLQASLGDSFGSYWSGHAHILTAGLSYKIPPRFNISFNSTQTFARLPEGNFVARILSSRVNYAASPFLSFSNLIQYDNRSRNLGWQSRVRWTLQPGNDLFLVFSQGWIQDTTGGYRFSAEDSKLSAKFQYAFRF